MAMLSRPKWGTREFVMRKLISVGIAAALGIGCASKVPGPDVSTYSYESEQHSGNVLVHEKAYTTTEKNCPAEWRSGLLHQPKGIASEFESNLKLAVSVTGNIKEPLELDVQIPTKLGDKIVLRDFQKHKEYALKSDSHGIMMQGDHFYHPDGFVVRVGHVEVDGWNIKGCVAIDRMYVTPDELDSGEPQIYLDRLTVPYAQRDGNPIRVSFGRYNDLEANIRIKP